MGATIRFGVGAALLLAATSARPAVQIEQFTLSVLPPPVESTTSTARAINAQGQIVGWFADSRSEDLISGYPGNPGGFLARPDGGGGYLISRFPTSSANTYDWLQPYDINSVIYSGNAGMIVGQARKTNTSVSYAFTFSNPGVSIANDGAALAVNDSARVVGWRTVSGEVQAFSFLGGTVSPLLPTSTVSESQAFDINQSNQIAGYYVDRGGASDDYRGFIYDWNSMTVSRELGSISIPQTTPSEWPQTFRAVSINSVGEVAATHEVASPSGAVSRAALFLSDGSVAELGSVGSYEESFAAGISDTNWVVGVLRSAGLPDSGFLWVAGQMIDLSELALPAGWSSITGVYDAISSESSPFEQTGTIVGQGIYNGETRGFAMQVIVQVPEPQIYLMFVVGVVALGFLRLRRLRRV